MDLDQKMILKEQLVRFTETLQTSVDTLSLFFDTALRGNLISNLIQESSYRVDIDSG